MEGFLKQIASQKNTSAALASLTGLIIEGKCDEKQTVLVACKLTINPGDLKGFDAYLDFFSAYLEHTSARAQADDLAAIGAVVDWVAKAVSTQNSAGFKAAFAQFAQSVLLSVPRSTEPPPESSAL